MNKKLILSLGMVALALAGFTACKGKKHDHIYDGYSHDGNQHWQVCTVEGCTEEQNRENHHGGTATETELAKCEVCNESYGSLKQHEHAYTVEKVDAAYLVFAASCESPATYYKSCTCGEVGTETFTSGSALDHDYGTEIARQEPTCSTAGTLAHYECSRCEKLYVKEGEVYTEVTAADLFIAATGVHAWDYENLSISVFPTEEEGGVIALGCSTCEEAYEIEFSNESFYMNDVIFSENNTKLHFEIAIDEEYIEEIVLANPNLDATKLTTALNEFGEICTLNDLGLDYAVVINGFVYQVGYEATDELNKFVFDAYLDVNDVVSFYCNDTLVVFNDQTSYYTATVECEHTFYLKKDGNLYVEKDTIVPVEPVYSLFVNNQLVSNAGVTPDTGNNAQYVVELAVGDTLVVKYNDGVLGTLFTATRAGQHIVYVNATNEVFIAQPVLPGETGYALFLNGEYNEEASVTPDTGNNAQYVITLAVGDKVVIKLDNVVIGTEFTAKVAGEHIFYVNTTNEIYISEPVVVPEGNVYGLYLNGSLVEDASVTPTDNNFAEFELDLVIGDTLVVKLNGEVIGVEFTATKNGTHHVYVNSSNEVYFTEPKAEAQYKVFYLTPNGNWKADNARFAVYAFGGSSGDIWIDMVDSDGDGVYEATIDIANYPQFIFCRMNPSSPTNNWTTKWNQTVDLTVEGAGTNNHYTVAEGAWDKGAGTWNEMHVHTYTLVPAVAATCKEEGSIEHYTCECGKKFTKEGEKYTEVKEIVIPVDANNHEEESSWVTTTTTHKKVYDCCGVTDVVEVEHTWENGVCTICTYACGHTGGEATCSTLAICDICNSSYGQLDGTKHESPASWTTQTAEKHEKTHPCCGHVEIELADHTMVEGTCTVCGYSAAHTGGEATCKSQAICDDCGQPYGPLDPDNHEGTAILVSKNDDEHELKYECCDHVVETKAHSHDFAGADTHDENQHWTVCSCGHTTEKVSHELGELTSKGAAGHNQSCECGYETKVVPHETKDASCKEAVKCSCGYILHEQLEHKYVYNYATGAITCEDCDYTGELTKVERTEYELMGTLPGTNWAQNSSLQFFNHPTNSDVAIVAIDLKVTQANKPYEFKLIINGAWSGPANWETVNGIFLSKYSSSYDGNAKLSVSADATYLFVLNKISNYMFVVEEAKEYTLSIIGSIGGTNWDRDFDLVHQGNGVYKATISLETGKTYQYKIRLNKAWTSSFGNDFGGNNASLTASKTAEYEFILDLYNATYTIEEVIHTYGELIKGTPASCTEAGTIDHYLCSHCNEYFVKNGETYIKVDSIIDPIKSHTEEIVTGKEATCTEAGLSDGKKCSVCNATLLEQTVISAKGHDYKSVVTKPTCLEEGYTTYTCTVCKHSYADNRVPAVGHKASEATKENEVAPDCTVAGSYDSVVYCSECKAELSRKTETVPATGHTNTSVVTKPTCTEKGYTTYTCSICNNVEVKDYVDALGHDYEEVVTAPTFDADGYSTFTCGNCGDEYVVEAEGTQLTVIATINGTRYASLTEAVAAAPSGSTIELVNNAEELTAVEVIGKAITINLNGKTVSTPNDTEGNGVFWVKQGATLTLTGNGTVNGKGASEYCMAVWADGGKVIINGGTYTNLGCQENDPGSTQFDLIYVKNGGEVIINGGTFEAQHPKWTLNSHDTKKGTFIVKGGKFLEYNPADNTTENPTQVWVEEGYCSVEVEKYFVVASHEYHSEYSNPTTEADGYWTVTCARCNHSYTVIDEDTKLGTAATVNGVNYATLTEAVAAAPAGSTIELVSNAIEVTAIVVNKEITINLNSHSIKVPNDTEGNGIFHIVKGGKLTINGDGLLDAYSPNNGYCMVVWADGGEVIINGGTYTNKNAYSPTDSEHYDLIYVKNGGKVTINGGTFIDETPRWTLNHNNDYQGTIVVNGGRFYQFDPANDQTDDDKDATVVGKDYCTVKDGDYYVVVTHTYEDEYTEPTFDSNGYTTYTCSNCGYSYKVEEEGTQLPYEAAVNGTKYATLAEALAKVEDGVTLTLFKDFKFSSIFTIDKSIVLDGNNHKITSTAARAINVSGGVKVTIKNITIETTGERGINVIQGSSTVEIENVTVKANNYAINLASSAAGSKVAISSSNLTGSTTVNVSAEDSIVTINDTEITTIDNFQTEGHASIHLGKDAVNAEVVATNVTINLTGTYPEGSMKACVDSEGGIITIDESTEEVVYNVAYITYGNYYLAFRDLQSAIDYAVNGETIHLIFDVIGTTSFEVEGKVITIDLHGKTVSIPNDTEGNGVFWVKEGATLTLTGNGTVNGKGASKWCMAVWADGGKVIIENGTYTNLGCQENDPGSTQFDLIYVKNGGEVIINGGTFEAQHPKWTLNSHDTKKGTFIVKGGKFLGYNPADNTTENPTQVWVEEGYCSVEVEGYYVVADHIYEAVVTDPTCTTGGYTTHTCTRCNHSYKDSEISALGHTSAAAVEENRVAATCTKEGSYDLVVYCSVCKDELERNTYSVEKVAHTPSETVEEKVVDSTCTEKGSYDLVVYCSECKAELSREAKEIAAKGHNEKVLPAVAATCTTEGKTEGKQCSVCEETLVAQETIPATGHSLDAGQYVSESGTWKLVKTCSVCSTTEKTTVANANLVTVNLSPISEWKSHDIYVYAFINEGQNIWIKLSSGTNGLYSATYPNAFADFTYVAITKDADASWNNKVYQTVDLKSSDGNGKKYITDMLDSEGKYYGVWINTNQVAVYFEDNWGWHNNGDKAPYIYYWGSSTHTTPNWKDNKLTVRISDSNGSYRYRAIIPKDVTGLLFHGKGQYGDEQSADVTDDPKDYYAYYMNYANNTKNAVKYDLSLI